MNPKSLVRTHSILTPHPWLIHALTHYNLLCPWLGSPSPDDR
jgi:hypothetical protein